MPRKDIFDFMEVNEGAFCFKEDVQKRIEFIIEKRGYFYMNEIEDVYAISESLGYSNLLEQTNDIQFIKNKMALRGASVKDLKTMETLMNKYFPKGLWK